MFRYSICLYTLKSKTMDFVRNLNLSTSTPVFFLSIFSPSSFQYMQCSNNSGPAVPSSTFYCLITWGHMTYIQSHALYISPLKYLFPIKFKISSCIDFYEQNRYVIHWMPNLLIFYSTAGKLQNRTSTVNYCWCHCLFPEEASNAISRRN